MSVLCSSFGQSYGSTFFCVVFGVYKYFAYLIIGTFWKEVEQSGWAGAKRSPTLVQCSISMTEWGFHKKHTPALNAKLC